jgi:hypothetical protein
MHRSSETIGAIAAALAKAQAELINPEKSLVATIRGRDPRDVERTFRYAPLSSGLEIVRKILGQHEIATVQTTALDREFGLIRLTTVLAHSSGEWMSSDWPVCAIADASAPQRMGAALTYARRYALFTLVGIAGEDDLNAPDLSGIRSNGTPATQSLSDRESAGPNGHATPTQSGTSRLVSKATPQPVQQILGPEASAECRDQLLDEMAGVSTADELALWAQEVLPTKNTLRNDDAAVIERTFTTKLEHLTHAAETSEDKGSKGEPAGDGAESMPIAERQDAKRCDADSASVESDGAVPGFQCADLAFGKTRRKRDKGHRAFVASKACLVCGRQPADAHHVRFAQPRALGRKVSDEFTVPLCRIHHRELHMRADEAAWWAQHAIDPIQIAQGLWQRSHAEEVTPAAHEGGQTTSGVNSEPASQ